MTADGDRGRGSLEGGEDVPELEGGGAVKQVTFFLIKKKKPDRTGVCFTGVSSPEFRDLCTFQSCHCH